MEKSLDAYFKNQVIESDKSSAKTQAGVTKAIKEKEKYEKTRDSLVNKIESNGKEIQRISKEIDNLEKEINETIV